MAHEGFLHFRPDKRRIAFHLLPIDRLEVLRTTDGAGFLAARTPEKPAEQGEGSHGVLLLFLVLHDCVSFSKCMNGPEDAAQLAGVFTLSVVVAS